MIEQSGEPSVIGIDFGSSRIKAAAYDLDGRLLASADRPTPIRHAPDGDDFLVLQMIDAALDALTDLAPGSRDVRAIGLSSMGEVGTLLDDRGLRDLAFPSWYDPRGAEIITTLESRFGSDELLVRTGGHTRVTSTLAKLGWWASEQDAPVEGTFVGLCGALAWRLTGEAWQEAGLAVTSGAYDWLTESWIPELWAAAGLEGVQLPPLRSARFSAPTGTEEAVRLGLPLGIPVVIAGHDHPIAAVGAGMRADEVGDSMGTGEALIAVMAPTLSEDEEHCRAVLLADPDLTFEVWPATGERLVVWERMRPGLAMQAFVRASGLERDRLDGDAPPPRHLTPRPLAAARALEAGDTSSWDFTAEGWGDVIDHYSATARVGEAILRAATGATGGVLLTGGGLRSPRWRRAKAFFASSPQVVSLVSETVTRGAAAIAGTAAGLWPHAETMPGAVRLDVTPGSSADLDRAAALLGESDGRTVPGPAT